MIMFIILGILIFIFFNNYNTFSIGIPTIEEIIECEPEPEIEVV